MHVLIDEDLYDRSFVESSCTGVNPLRGQNNVQGACDMGALPNVFPGYQPVAPLFVRNSRRLGRSPISLIRRAL